MHPLLYGVALVPGLTVLVTLWVGGGWLWLAPLMIFGVTPVAELVVSGSIENASPEAEKERRQDWRFDAMLYAVVPLQLAIVGSLVFQVATGGLQGIEVLSAVVAAGLSCGSYGINVAHELGHRSGTRDRRLAKLLLLTSLYMHFFIEHNRGHHKKVATIDDPASSRRGEWLYAFWARSVLGGWRSAWRLEAARLERRRRPVWSWDNEMLRFQVIQLFVVGAILIGGGVAAAAAFVGAAVIGFLLLETVNYVEHYGLARSRGEDGRWERVRPAHSWNSNHPLGRVLLFDLTRHADHHAHPARPYAVLRHFEHAPQLPTGYPGMILLALVPPLFIRVMDRWVSREQNRVEVATAA